jgi:tRNA modification GTPase
LDLRPDAWLYRHQRFLPILTPEDTVFALASGGVPAAIAVLRVSGPGSAAMLRALCGAEPPPRRASLRRLRDPSDGTVLDQALTLWLPGPNTYTGEDSAELHLHGGRAVIAAVTSALIGLGARPAEPGEFTKRAFLNGRLDLTEAEAVHDLIQAETEAQRRQALRQLEGGLGDLYRDWAEQLRAALARQEALIDFPDEDLPPEVEAALLATIETVAAAMTAHLDDGHRGERLREGLVVAIIGPPNVGKSSLINALAGRDVAIVSPIPGTTRDALETRIALAGVPLTLIDTAGLRDTQDPIEAEGVRRARARARDADLVILLTSPDTDRVVPERPGLLVVNKIDLDPTIPPGSLGISTRTGAGLDTLLERLTDFARGFTAGSAAPLTRARHRLALREALDHLHAARAADLPELRGEDLRLALRAIGRITGHVGVEDILDTLFGAFCIGK